MTSTNFIKNFHSKNKKRLLQESHHTPCILNHLNDLCYYLLIWFSTLKLWAGGSYLYFASRWLPAGKSIAKILTKHYTLLIKIQHCYLYLPWWRCVLYGGAHYTLLKTFFIRMRIIARKIQYINIYVYVSYITILFN